MKGMSPNIEEALTWPKMDLVLRVGESNLTYDDPGKNWYANCN